MIPEAGAEGGGLAFGLQEMEKQMLAKCANPACSTSLRYLESGKLFRLESDPWCSSENKVREYFWLCRGCAATLTLRLDETSRIRVAPAEAPPRLGEDGVDFILLERQNGMLLTRITLFQHRGQRRQTSEGGQPHL